MYEGQLVLTFQPTPDLMKTFQGAARMSIDNSLRDHVFSSSHSYIQTEQN